MHDSESHGNIIWKGLQFIFLNTLLLYGFQYVEDIHKNIGPLSGELKDKIADLSQDIKDRKLPEKVLQAETHAAQLNHSSAKLDGYVNYDFVFHTSNRLFCRIL